MNGAKPGRKLGSEPEPGPELQCPICEMVVVSEQQLSRHIDDEHSEKTNTRKRPEEHRVKAKERRQATTLTPNAVINTKFDEFKLQRTQFVEQKELRFARLEQRLTRLVSGLAQLEAQTTSGSILSRSEQQKRREIEQSIAVWEDESHVSRCRLCSQKFTFFQRKHHCRICGRTVCGDFDRTCSREVSLAVLAEKLARSDLVCKSQLSTRICQECRDCVFGKSNFKRDLEAPPPRFLQLQKHLKNRQTQIELLLPRFEQFVDQIASGECDQGVLAECKANRLQLLSALSQFDSISKKLIAEPVDNATEEWIKQRIVLWAAEYLQAKMLPLNSLPAAIKAEQAPKLGKDEALELQNKLVVMEEQRYLVEKMYLEAKQRRKFDELVPLEASLKELSGAISKMRLNLGSFAPS